MKTPEQIAEAILRDESKPHVHAPYSAAWEFWQGRIAAAINADRAQRAENTVTIDLDAEHRPEETVAEVLAQIERGNTSGYYPTWEMNYTESDKEGED